MTHISSVRLGFFSSGAAGFRKHSALLDLSGAVQRGKQLVSLLTAWPGYAHGTTRTSNSQAISRLADREGCA
jgi:hypothetical protein